MAWFSYFLLSVPEAFLLLAVSFALFGISISKEIKSMVIFSFLYGGITFSLSIIMQSSLKPLLTFIIFSLLVAYFFRFKLISGIIIGLISFIFLFTFEILMVPLFMQLFSLSVEQIISTPWLRIAAGLFTLHLPMLLLLLFFKLSNLKIKLPLLTSASHRP
ncbi:hypothetical protein NC661_04780 [Aquibacillus koreensis]|uniref:Uncharacterized protein n=1 Tax=Aquibacillus koreensis TaxID=279446 RepID=A0A9X4AHG3_9BACI|nr:hypothetical protein [Aquibacillus koreensis]MCT2534711.1 hypothetical protein [Aquibacillus koreensis]MDC3419679.1 hypothetical protein [Aquibacillus koreensis]